MHMLGAQYTTDCVVTYLFHDNSPDGDRHPSILSCKLLAVTRESKLTLRIALNPKSKLAVERGTNASNAALFGTCSQPWHPVWC